MFVFILQHFSNVLLCTFCAESCIFDIHFCYKAIMDTYILVLNKIHTRKRVKKQERQF